MAGLSVSLMGAIAGLLMDLRNDWAVQILVLFSFSLQVFLLMLAWIRRHKVAALLRFLLWLAYQLADSTALFTLGHMAIKARSPNEQQLMALWAPFLLVHLGGQDTITAYSFEDNRLWLRHLQTLIVQILGVAYILYKYIPGSETLIRAAAVLVFVVGGLKYGERIFTLRSASMDSIWRSLDKSDASGVNQTGGDRGWSESTWRRWITIWWHCIDDEDILMVAHSLLDVCKGLFTGARQARPAHIKDIMQLCRDGRKLDMLMEMELSLMYDIMYTKAAVICTWHGCCIRVISPVATAVAFLLFWISSNKDGHRHKKNDVVITYVLLAGALFLEMASLLKAAASTWTVALFFTKEWTPRSWVSDFQAFRLFARAARRRTWSGTVGQYNLLQSWALDRAEPAGSKMAKYMGLERWWYYLRHSHSCRISSSTKELVLREILEMGSRRNISSQPGLLALQQHKLDALLDWSIQDSDLEGSIIAWHVATEIITATEDTGQGSIDDEWDRSQVSVTRGYDRRSLSEDVILKKACREVSRYMMFLFMVRPYMLPGPIRRSRYADALNGWNTVVSKIFGEVVPPKRMHHWVIRSFRKMLHQGPLSQRQGDFLDVFPDNLGHRSDYGPALEGFSVAEALIYQSNRLQVIFAVWVEMLCYVANHCSRESHASQLSSGGELGTIVWLMAGHANLANISAEYWDD